MLTEFHVEYSDQRKISREALEMTR